MLKIVGDFSLKKKDDQYVIADKKTEIEIGDWTKQGYPFFSGTGVYETTFDLPKDYLDGKLFLHLNCGEDVAEIIVNDSDAIVIPWNPYKADITKHVKAGKNTIKIKITNTLIVACRALPARPGKAAPGAAGLGVRGVGRPVVSGSR